MAAHEKLLEKMRVSTAGWGQDDLRRLYEGYGFARREGANHTFYQHPDFPQLTASVGRHNQLANGYAQTAVLLLDSLFQLQEQAKAAKAEIETKSAKPPVSSATTVSSKKRKAKNRSRKGKRK